MIADRQLYRKGDLIVLQTKPERPYQMSANKGAVAIVVAPETSGQVRVRWLCGQNGQMDGGYRSPNFRYANLTDQRTAAQILQNEADAAVCWTPPPPPPVPLKVGDKVSTRLHGAKLGEIRFIEDDYAFIKNSSEYVAWRINNLKLTENPCDC